MRSGRCGRAAAAAKTNCWPACYRTAIALAAARRLRSIAFSAISTGVYGFPADRAARIAVGTVVSALGAEDARIERVVFCCFSDESADHHAMRSMSAGWCSSRVPDAVQRVTQ